MKIWVVNGPPTRDLEALDGGAVEGYLERWPTPEDWSYWFLDGRGLEWAGLNVVGWYLNDVERLRMVPIGGRGGREALGAETKKGPAASEAEGPSRKRKDRRERDGGSLSLSFGGPLS